VVDSVNCVLEPGFQPRGSSQFSREDNEAGRCQRGRDLAFPMREMVCDACVTEYSPPLIEVGMQMIGTLDGCAGSSSDSGCQCEGEGRGRRACGMCWAGGGMGVPRTSEIGFAPSLKLAPPGVTIQSVSTLHLASLRYALCFWLRGLRRRDRFWL
jgi:hypothetical protein